MGRIAFIKLSTMVGENFESYLHQMAGIAFKLSTTWLEKNKAKKNCDKDKKLYAFQCSMLNFNANFDFFMPK